MGAVGRFGLVPHKDPVLSLSQGEDLYDCLTKGWGFLSHSYLQDHPRTCKWLVTTIFKPRMAIGRGPTTPSLENLLTMVIWWSSKYPNFQLCIPAEMCSLLPRALGTDTKTGWHLTAGCCSRSETCYVVLCFQGLSGWCLTPTLSDLICSSFSRENGHLVLTSSTTGQLELVCFLGITLPKT